MNKKELCVKNAAIASYGLSNTACITIHHIDDDVLYYAVNILDNTPTYHKSKIYYTANAAYFVWGKIRINLNECIRTNLI